MKYLTLIAFLLFPFTLHADLEIIQEVTSEGMEQATNGMGQDRTIEMTLKIKGENARMDMGNQMSMIIDAKNGDMTTLIHAQKMVMVTNQAQIQNVLQQFSGQKEEEKEISIEAPKPTGNKETINGYDTEEYTVSYGEDKINFWIAKDFPNYKKVLKQWITFGKQMEKLSPIKALNKLDPETLPGVPIRTVFLPAKGGSATTLVKSISDKDLDESNFKIPADYQTMHIPSFGVPANQ